MARRTTKETLLRILGVLVLVLALAALAMDVLVPDVPGGSEASRAGFRFGQAIGIVLRTAILGGVALALFGASNGSQRDAGARERFRRIVEEHRDEMPDSRPAGAEIYSAVRDEELLELYERMDRRTRPEHFAGVLWLIQQRGARGTDGEKQAERTDNKGVEQK